MLGEAPTPRYGHTAVLDSVHDRVIVFGGWGATGGLGDVWVLTLAGTPSWSRLEPLGEGPPTGSGHCAVYDSEHDRMLVYAQGGVWQLSIGARTVWALVAPAGTGPVRSSPAMVLDPIRDRLVIFGGYDGLQLAGDTWSLSLDGTAVWSQLDAGVLSARMAASAVYDPYDDRMLIFGGLWSGAHGLQIYFSDVWSLPLSSPGSHWELVAPETAGPAGRAMHAACFDPIRRRMIVHGGNGNGSLDDVWELDLANGASWVRIHPENEPPPRGEYSGVYDEARRRLVALNVADGHVWVLDPDGWRMLPTSGLQPVPRYGTAVLDSDQQRMLVFGGASESRYLNDVWAFSLVSETWSRIEAAGTPPTPRLGHSAIYDPVRKRMIVYGGVDSLHNALGDLWELDFTPSPSWLPIGAQGGPPTPRLAHSAIYDPVRDAMVIFGGHDRPSPGPPTYFSDVWTLSLSGTHTWIPLGSSLPGPRGDHVAAFDPIGDRMVVFGGTYMTTDTYIPLQKKLDEVWEYDLAQGAGWRRLSPGPSARWSSLAAYEPGSGRWLIFGGLDGDWENDTWELQLQDTSTTATLLAHFDARPVARGIELSWEFGDPGRVVEWWIERALSATGPWETVALEHHADGRGEVAVDPSPGVGETYFYRLAVRDPSGTSVRFGPISATRGSASVGTVLEAPVPNPSRAGVQLAFALDAPGAVRLSILDVAGREVARPLDGPRLAGRFTVAWDGTQRDGRLASPGLYFAQLRTAHETLVRRIAIAR